MSHTAEFVAGASDPAQLPRLSHPEIAFAGRSNVGKSSLLNRLVGQRKLARVSKTPGRTQQINFFLIDDRLTFVDLPGYGFARVPLPVREQWKQLVEGYLSTRRNLRAVVVIVDLRRGVQAEDAALLDYLRALDVAAIVVATKADKVGRSEQRRGAQDVAKAVPGACVVIASATSGEGIEQVWKEIAARVERVRR